jgi:hypothetical protein
MLKILGSEPVHSRSRLNYCSIKLKISSVRVFSVCCEGAFSLACCVKGVRALENMGSDPCICATFRRNPRDMRMVRVSFHQHHVCGL